MMAMASVFRDWQEVAVQLTPFSFCGRDRTKLLTRWHSEWRRDVPSLYSAMVPFSVVRTSDFSRRVRSSGLGDHRSSRAELPISFEGGHGRRYSTGLPARLQRYYVHLRGPPGLPQGEERAAPSLSRQVSLPIFGQVACLLVPTKLHQARHNRHAAHLVHFPFYRKRPWLERDRESV